MNAANRTSAVALLAPSVGLIALFVLVPVALTVWLSFHQWSTQTSFATATWIGLDNFRSGVPDRQHPDRSARQYWR